jgi:hypothetical protein
MEVRTQACCRNRGMIVCHRRKEGASAGANVLVGRETYLEKEFEMQRAIAGMLLLIGLLFAACGTQAPVQTQAGASGKPLVTVYRSPT